MLTRDLYMKQMKTIQCREIQVRREQSVTLYTESLGFVTDEWEFNEFLKPL